MSFQYNPNIPSAPNDPADDQPIMQLNAAAINGIIGVDHVGFNTLGGGFHKKSTYVNQGTPPVSAANSLVLYATTTGSGTELHMVRDGNALTDTKLTSASIIAPTVSGDGCTFLPGGLLLQWGTNAFSNPVLYTQAFAAPAFSIQLTPRGSGLSSSSSLKYSISATTTTSFSYQFFSSSFAPMFLYWIAIGQAP